MTFLRSLTGVLLISFCLWIPARGLAFGLGDHRNVTLQAVTEFNRCFKTKIDPFQSFVLWQSDLNEDLNLIRKETLYSHFYNPNKTLNMRRYDSSVSVLSYQENLEHMAKKSWENLDNLSTLGHAIHHIQDMTVPSHVVPVMHGFDDGLEVFKFEGDISSGLPCEGLVEMMRGQDLMALLKSTALTTLANLDQTKVPVHVDELDGALQTDVTSTAEAFWKPSDNHDFGQYGYLGNNFGKTEFSIGSVHYRVSETFYKEFKQRQLRLAVQQTLKALLWWATKNPTGEL